MEEVSDIVHPGASRGVRTFAWAGLVIIVGSMLGILIAFFFQNGEDLGTAGETEEDRTERPSDLVIPTIVDVTAAWGLDTWESVGADPLRGGATLHDLDGDGDLDLVVAGGSLGIYLWEGDRYTSGPSIAAGDAIAAHAGDVDGDGAVDLLVGRSDGASIVWGGSALLDGATPEILDLGVDGVVTGAVPADLGLGSASVVVLGHGGAEPIADQVLTFDGRDIVDRVVLPNSDRKSASLEILDLEGDGVAELWIGRDLGWSSGGDSVYSRGGAVDGAWVDIAPGLGVDLEIDTMAVTIADWTEDGRLDAYLSDLGDNEFVVRSGETFDALRDVGAAHIRGLDADDNEISRSWGSGAVDWNLDGLLDLIVVNGGFAEISVRNKVVNTFIVEDDPPAILLRTSDGGYYDAWADAGLPWAGRSRGLALGDIDDDGDTDMIVSDHEGGLHALRNDLPSGGEKSRRSATCLPDAAVVASSDDDGYTALQHQQSFLGAHAPEFVIPSAQRRVFVVDCPPPDATS